MSCGVGCRCGSEPALLWLWCRLAATAPIGPLAWKPPYAVGVAQEMAKKGKKKKKKKAWLFSCFWERVLLHPPATEQLGLNHLSGPGYFEGA